ncbi:MAG: 4-hydroxyphenylacetate 3-hydroxylase N-terminal domain-containing protein [Chloroflexota bacterium]
MLTSEEFRKRLFKMRRNVYLDGERIGRDDARLERQTNVYSLTYDLATDPEMLGLATATSSLSGQTINRFCHIHQSVEDLLCKQRMTRLGCHRAGGCIERCMGIDALNAISVVSYDADRARGTEYNRRFTSWMRDYEEKDYTACMAQTDVKGNRPWRPHQQADPDLYLRVVEEKSDGIVIRGAKAHNTMAPLSDWLMVMPTRRLVEGEGEWAVACAVPADADGVKLIAHVSAPPPRQKLTAPFSNFGHVDCLTVFDNVLVPWEHVFLYGETDLAGELASLAALFHRHSYTGCKPSMTDIIIGATALIAEYNGIEQASHVREKLADMISVAELCYGTGVAAAVNAKKSASGTYVPDPVYCNVSRRHAGLNIYHEFDTLCDIAGGLPATLPSEADWYNEEIRPYLEKYIMRKPGISAEDQHRAFRFVADLSASAYTAWLQYAGVHGGGSPRMEELAILGAYDIEARKNVAKRLAGIRPA